MIINKEVLNSKPIKKENYTERDLFEYTLEVASEMNNDIDVFMESIMDFGKSKDKKVFNFGAIIESIFNALMNALRKLFKQFLALLAQLASMGASFELELRGFKDKIKNLNTQVKLDFPYYKFTNLATNYPDTRSIENNVSDFVERYSNDFTGTVSRYAGNSLPKLAELQERLNAEKQQNMFRNTLLGRRGTEDCNDFAADLHAYFRNSSSTPMSGVTLDGKDIYKDYYEPYVNYAKDTREIKKQQEDIEKTINKIKKEVSNKFNVNLSQFEAGTADQINNYKTAIERKVCVTVDLMCQDVLLFYGQKLQAYKDYKIQCKKILVCAVKTSITQ